MVADLRDATSLEHYDAVRLAKGADSVCNGNGGAALDQNVERFLDFSLRFGVHSGCRFIEDQDSRIG